VAFDAGKSARLRPATIAIHDYGDVAGNSFGVSRHLAALIIWNLLAAGKWRGLQ
jgi:hypothetical protein